MKKTLLVSLLGLMSATSYAGVIEFSDRAVWESNTANVTTIDFEGYVSSSFANYPGTDAGVTFTSPNNASLFAIDETYAESGGPFTLGTGDVLFSYSEGINAALPGNVTSVGVDLGGYLESSTMFDIVLSTGEVFSATFTNPEGGFWGVTSDVAIASILFDPTSSYITMDNFSFGVNSGSVPEPTSLFLLSMGLLGMSGLRKKKIA